MKHLIFQGAIFWCNIDDKDGIFQPWPPDDRPSLGVSSGNSKLHPAGQNTTLITPTPNPAPPLAPQFADYPSRKPHPNLSYNSHLMSVS